MADAGARPVASTLRLAVFRAGFLFVAFHAVALLFIAVASMFEHRLLYPLDDAWGWIWLGLACATPAVFCAPLPFVETAFARRTPSPWRDWAAGLAAATLAFVAF